MCLLDYGEWVIRRRAAKVLWSSFRAAVVDNDDFKLRCVRLLRQGLQTLLKGYPIVVSGYDNAESRYQRRFSFALSHGPSDCRSELQLQPYRISHSLPKSKLAHSTLVTIHRQGRSFLS
jgi:hypothetical protein